MKLKYRNNGKRGKLKILLKLFKATQILLKQWCRLVMEDRVYFSVISLIQVFMFSKLETVRTMELCMCFYLCENSFVFYWFTKFISRLSYILETVGPTFTFILAIMRNWNSNPSLKCQSENQLFGKEYTDLRSGEHDFEEYGQGGDDERGVSDKFGETLLTWKNDFIESGQF